VSTGRGQNAVDILFGGIILMELLFELVIYQIGELAGKRRILSTPLP